MDRDKLLITITEELIKDAAKAIGWEMDGSEIDLVTSMPEWEEAIKGSLFEKQLEDIIAVVHLWSYNTKRYHM